MVLAVPRAVLGARQGAAGRRHPGALSGAGARGVRGGVPGAPRVVCMIEFKVCGWFRNKHNATSRNRLAPGFGETPGTLAQACSARVGKPCPPLFADGVSNAAITSSRKPNRAVAEAKEFPGTVRGACGWRESGQGRHTRLGVEDAFFRGLFTSCAPGAGGRSGTLHYYSCICAVGVCAAGRR